MTNIRLQGNVNSVNAEALSLSFRSYIPDTWYMVDVKYYLKEYVKWNKGKGVYRTLKAVSVSFFFFETFMKERQRIINFSGLQLE